MSQPHPALGSEAIFQHRSNISHFVTISPMAEPLPTPGKHKLKIKVNFRALGKKLCSLNIWSDESLLRLIFWELNIDECILVHSI